MNTLEDGIVKLEKIWGEGKTKRDKGQTKEQHEKASKHKPLNSRISNKEKQFDHEWNTMKAKLELVRLQ